MVEVVEATSLERELADRCGDAPWFADPDACMNLVKRSPYVRPPRTRLPFRVSIVHPDDTRPYPHVMPSVLLNDPSCKSVNPVMRKFARIVMKPGVDMPFLHVRMQGMPLTHVKAFKLRNLLTGYTTKPLFWTPTKPFSLDRYHRILVGVRDIIVPPIFKPFERDVYALHVYTTTDEEVFTYLTIEWPKNAQ